MPRRHQVVPLLTCVAAMIGTFAPQDLGAQSSGQASQPPVRSVYSARDAIGWTVESVIEDMRQLPTTAVEQGAAISTLTDAMAAARTVAERRSAPALRAFLDTTSLDPQDLRLMAAYAAMNGGEGTMALLLAAERRRPGDWSTQYNIGVFLLLEGYPRASKVILDSLLAPTDALAPGGLDLRATLLLGRGNALIATGRPRQAIPLLREARQREPVLAEAGRSLAFAHLLVKEEAEARRALRLGGQRYASTAEMENADKVPPIIDPMDQIDQGLLIEALRQRDGPRLTLNDRWPLYKGRGASLETMTPPSYPEGLSTFLQQLERKVEELKAQMEATTSAIEPAVQQLAADKRDWGIPMLRAQLQSDAMLPWGALPAMFASPCTTLGPWEGNLFNRAAADRAADEAFASERLDDETLASQARRMRRSAAAMCSRLMDSKLWEQHVRDLADRIGRCQSGDEYVPCVCRARRDVAALQLSTINAEYQPFLSATKSWYNTANHHATAVAGYIEPEDSLMRTLVQDGIDAQKAMTAAGVHQHMLVQYRMVTPLCPPEEPPRDSVVGKLQKWEKDDWISPCSSGDGASVKQDFVIVAVKVKCYEIEVEKKRLLPVPGLSLYGSLSYAFDGPNAGNVTVVTGVGAGMDVMGVDIGAKAGVFTTFNGTKFVDGGMRLSESAQVGKLGNSASQKLSFKEAALDGAGTATYISNSFVAVVSP